MHRKTKQTTKNCGASRIKSATKDMREDESGNAIGDGTHKTISYNGKTLHYHHTASRRGYCRVSEIGSIEEYEGRYGKGVIMRRGRYNGSTWYESITYYVED